MSDLRGISSVDLMMSVRGGLLLLDGNSFKEAHAQRMCEILMGYFGAAYEATALLHEGRIKEGVSLGEQLVNSKMLRGTIEEYSQEALEEQMDKFVSIKRVFESIKDGKPFSTKRRSEVRAILSRILEDYRPRREL
jgi:hypothetical protein